MNIVVIGGVSYDTIIDVDELKINSEDQSIFAKDKRHSIGGTGAGKSLALDVLGHKNHLYTVIGNDPEGQVIKEYFNKTGITVSYCKADHSICHTNIMYGEGNRLSIFTQVPTESETSYSKSNNDIQEADLIFLNIDTFTKHYFKDIAQSSALLVVDVHDYDEGNTYHQPFIDLADIVVASAVNIPEQETFLARLIDSGKELVVLTRGKNGYIAMDNKKTIYQGPGYTLDNFVDSNGAGDAFTASLSVQYLLTKNIGKSLEYANLCGAIACTSHDLFPLDLDKSFITKTLKNQ